MFLEIVHGKNLVSTYGKFDDVENWLDQNKQWHKGQLKPLQTRLSFCQSLIRTIHLQFFL